MTLNWQALSFDELSNRQLYAMLRLRSEVFVLEQDCVYQDLDDFDQDAVHVLGLDDAGAVACCARLLAPGLKYSGASIGRVVTSPTLRGTGQGRALLAKAVQVCEERYPNTEITLSAQQHLERFYAGFGFTTRSEPYLEDGIPHLKMTRESPR